MINKLRFNLQLHFSVSFPQLPRSHQLLEHSVAYYLDCQHFLKNNEIVRLSRSLCSLFDSRVQNDRVRFDLATREHAPCWRSKQSKISAQSAVQRELSTRRMRRICCNPWSSKLGACSQQQQQQLYSLLYKLTYICHQEERLGI